MREQHFPYLDREKEWFGLEVIDIMFILLAGVITGIILTIIFNFPIGILGGVISAIGAIFLIVKGKRGKARGWLARQLYFIFRLWNVIY